MLTATARADATNPAPVLALAQVYASGKKLSLAIEMYERYLVDKAYYVFVIVAKVLGRAAVGLAGVGGRFRCAVACAPGRRPGSRPRGRW